VRGCLALALCSSAVAAVAQEPCPPLTIQECDDVIDVAGLRRALAAEGLVCRVRLRCVDGDLEVDGARLGQELGTIPSPVRERILALLVIERRRRAPPEPEGSGEPAAVPPAPDAPPAEATAPASATPVDEAEQSVPPPAPAPPPADPPASPPESRAPEPIVDEAVVAEALDPPSLLERASPVGLFDHRAEGLDPRRSPLLGVGASLRLFGAPATAVVGPAIDLAWDLVRVELGWSFGLAESQGLGQADLSLGHASVGVALLCASWEAGALCGSAYGTVGYARAAGASNEGARTAVIDGPYVDGFLEVAGWVTRARVAVFLKLRGGWGYGLVVTGAGEELAALGGAFFGAALGVDLGVFR
jgi:hypothetical protein